MSKHVVHQAGERPHTVTVYRRPDRGGALYGRTWVKGKPVKRSLGDMTKGEAIDWADEEAARLAAGAEALRNGRVTLGVILDLYLENETPTKGEKARKGDRRHAAAWSRWLGRDADPMKVTQRQWRGFIEARTSGAINARGEPVPEGKRRPVRARTVEVSAGWLQVVMRWAVNWRTAEGTYLLSENPLRGFETPTEKNPRRPVASTDRYRAVREAAEGVEMEIRWGGKVVTQRSYLAEILDLAYHTGRRISAICALRHDDVRPERSEARPHGAIRWRADEDKEGKEWVAPMNAAARAAVERIKRERPGIGPRPLFPKPTDPEAPITRHLVDKWLRRAEKLAKVEDLDGSLWHAYRRAWATMRKHHPAQDVAAAGGWSSPETVARIYQQADEATTLQVVLDAGEIRETGS